MKLRKNSLPLIVLAAAALVGCSPASNLPTPTPTHSPITTAAPTATPTSAPTATPTITSSPSPAPTPTDAPDQEWSTPVRISDTLFWHLAAAADTDGHLHVIGATRLPGRGLSYLTNASGAWTEEQFTAPAAEGTDDDPTIGIDAEGRIWVTFRRWSIYEECGLSCSRDPSRIDDRYVTARIGGAWLEPITLGLAAYGNDLSLVLDEQAVDGGTFQAAYVAAVHQLPRVRYATNSSGEWSGSVEDVAEGYGPHLTFGSDGHPRIAFSTGENAGGLATRNGGEWQTEPIYMGEEPNDATVEALLVDSNDQSLVVYSVFEEGAGYRSYVVVRESYDSTSTYPLADGIVDEALIGPDDSVHGLYSVFDSESSDGVWYAHGLISIETMTRISESVRVVPDGAAAAQTLLLDSNGTPHVFYATPYDEIEGLMYAVGPTP